MKMLKHEERVRAECTEIHGQNTIQLCDAYNSDIGRYDAACSMKMSRKILQKREIHNDTAQLLERVKLKRQHNE